MKHERNTLYRTARNYALACGAVLCTFLLSLYVDPVQHRLTLFLLLFAVVGTTWYGGVNYGKNPIPAEHLSPILAAILEWHVTAGLRWQIARGWALTAGVEYQLHKQANSANPQAVFGRSTEHARGVVFPMMLSARW